ncbi:MAG: DNA-processing protein DprA [Fimbriimonadaceae bacterium]|nr:DNA-processing protein DprA [Fimbriimonadaceae bacterium]
MLLALTPGIGGRTLVRILARCDLMGQSPYEFFALSPEALKEDYGLPNKLAGQVSGSMDRLVSELSELEQKLESLGVHLVTAADAHFPARLDGIDLDPPPALFLYGNQKLLETKTFCILSSRSTPPKGLEMIEKLAEQGVLKGEVLVSGHDRPEYQRSAVVPLRWGSPRILCLDRGMFAALGDDLSVEPFRTARLWRFQFDKSTDLVVSPFRPNAGFAGVNNQVRDRLVAALSDRMDFVLVNPGGNMDKLARAGLKAGRQVRVSDLSLKYRQYRELGAEVLDFGI